MEKAKTQTEKSRDIRLSVDKENVKIKSPTQRTYSTPSNTNSYISSPLSTPPLSTTDYLTTRLVHLIWPYEGFDGNIEFITFLNKLKYFLFSKSKNLRYF